MKTKLGEGFIEGDLESSVIQFNPWWATGKVREDWLKLFKRPLFYKLLDFLKDRQALLLFGLRRTGKSILFMQLIQHLLDLKIEPKNILYFSFDEKAFDLKNVLSFYETEVLKKPLEEGGRKHVFFDEVHKCEDWQDKIKVYYDLYPNAKFFLSGSASISLQKHARESLAGRIYDFKLPVLSFKEFLALKGFDVKKIEAEPKIFERELSPLLFDYARKGGFPELVEEEKDEKIKAYIKSSVIERIIYKDLPKEFGLRDPEMLENILKIVANNPGMLANYASLAKDFRRDERVVSNYFSYLEYALLLQTCSNYRRGFLVTRRKLKKTYLSNTGLVFALNENYEASMPKVFENLVANLLNAKFFWKAGSKEVDAVVRKNGEPLPVEIKYGKIEEKNILSFMKKFGCSKGVFVTKDVAGKKIFNGKEVTIVPAWTLFAGEQSIESR